MREGTRKSMEKIKRERERQKARDGTYTEVTSSRPVSPSLLNSTQTMRRTGHTHETTGTIHTEHSRESV